MKELTGGEDDRPSAGGGTEGFTSVIENATDPDSAVYDTNRVGGAFQYGLTPAQGIKPKTSYTVLLHAADLYWSKPSQRTFTVSAKGVPVLTDYDVIAEAGTDHSLLIFSALHNAFWCMLSVPSAFQFPSAFMCGLRAASRTLSTNSDCYEDECAK